MDITFLLIQFLLMYPWALQPIPCLWDTRCTAEDHCPTPQRPGHLVTVLGRSPLEASTCSKLLLSIGSTAPRDGLAQGKDPGWPCEMGFLDPADYLWPCSQY